MYLNLGLNLFYSYFDEFSAIGRLFWHNKRRSSVAEGKNVSPVLSISESILTALELTNDSTWPTTNQDATVPKDGVSDDTEDDTETTPRCPYCC